MQELPLFDLHSIYFLVILFLILDLICNETVKGFHGTNIGTPEYSYFSLALQAQVNLG